MNEPNNLVDITETRLLIIALARCTADETLEGAGALLDAIDHRQGLLVAARLISDLCGDLAAHQGRTGQALLDAMVTATIEAAANPRPPRGPGVAIAGRCARLWRTNSCCLV